VTKYALIGAGQMGFEHILTLRYIADTEIVAVCEPNEQSRELAKSALGKDSKAVFFNDHRELIDAKLADVVIIATPNFTHEEILCDILGRDIHILIEKPLATTVNACKNIIKRAEDHKNIIWVGLEYRFIPVISKLREMVEEGFVGDVKMIFIREHRYPFLPKVNNWNRFNKNTGGTLVEKCCHFFDLMALLSNSKPTVVAAYGGQDVNHLDEIYDNQASDIIDNAYVIAEFENSTRACLDLCMFAEGSSEEQELSVVGNEGKIEAKIPSSALIYGKRKNRRHGIKAETVKNDDIKFYGFHWGSIYKEHVELLSAIKAGNKPKVGLESGLVSVAMGQAAQISIEQKRTVSIDELI
jgi:myo-inositol 2-dehydrogenase/D-chiro-inositol 1-dehydrogenase